MTELTEILHQQEPITPEQAGRMTTSWPGLLTSPIKTDEQYLEIQQSLGPLCEPAQPTWIMARVAALLSQYYAADVPAAAVAIMAEDWLEELREYPQWAITNAVRWWKSYENPNRKKKPLEGDIAERARLEVGVIKVAEKALRDFDVSGPPKVQVDDRPVLTPQQLKEKRDRADGIVAGAGIKLRRATPISEADQWAAE